MDGTNPTGASLSVATVGEEEEEEEGGGGEGIGSLVRRNPSWTSTTLLRVFTQSRVGGGNFPAQNPRVLILGLKSGASQTTSNRK